MTIQKLIIMNLVEQISLELWYAQRLCPGILSSELKIFRAQDRV